MSEQNPFDPEAKKLPSLLNVLTILTYIGCALGLIFGVMGLVNGRKNVDELEKLQDSGQADQVPGFLKSFTGPEALANARLAYENRIPIFILTLVGIALCLYGAMQMRKLQKNGYFMWLIGELLPTVGSIFLVGIAFAASGGWFYLFPLLFIILYTTQLKYLK